MPHLTEDLETLRGRFQRMGIEDLDPGFYDHPAFLAEEQVDPTFLGSYARYVHEQTYALDYLERARRVVGIVSRILHEQLVAEGRLGACVDLSMVLSRILERERIWNFMVKGALTISFPSKHRLPTLYLWPYDVNRLPGHVWVAAPPFQVIDLTLKQQPWESRVSPHLPNFVLIEKGTRVTAKVEDICSPEIRASHATRGASPRDLHFRLTPTLRDVFRLFPGVQVFINQVRFKYFVCAFSASDGSLEDITNQAWNGRFGLQIYNELVRPALLAEGL